MQKCNFWHGPALVTAPVPFFWKRIDSHLTNKSACALLINCCPYIKLPLSIGGDSSLRSIKLVISKQIYLWINPRKAFRRSKHTMWDGRWILFLITGDTSRHTHIHLLRADSVPELITWQGYLRIQVLNVTAGSLAQVFNSTPTVHISASTSVSASGTHTHKPLQVSIGSAHTQSA